MPQDLKLTAITLTEENGDQARNLGLEGKGEGSEGVVGVEELGVCVCVVGGIAKYSNLYLL